MAVYLARLIEDRQIVGFFNVDDKKQLFWLIDECCDPHQVEVTELPMGGLYWSSSVDFQVPIPEDENGEPTHDTLPPDPTLSAEWSGIIFANETLEWERVPGDPDLED